MASTKTTYFGVRVSEKDFTIFAVLMKVQVYSDLESSQFDILFMIYAVSKSKIFDIHTI